MSFFMFRIPIYTFKWLFVAKIYIIYEYRIITIGLQVNKWPFYISKFFFNCAIDIFKLLFNENIINPRMARYSLNIHLICKRRNGFIFFSFREMQSQSGAKLNFKFYMYFRQENVDINFCPTLRLHISKTKKDKSIPSFAY